MDVHPDRPSELPCVNCGALVPISWASGHGVATCRACARDSFVFVPPLPLADLVVALDGLMWPAHAGAGAGAGACDRPASRQLSAPFP